MTDNSERIYVIEKTDNNDPYYTFSCPFCVCEDETTADSICKYLNRRDPVFDYDYVEQVVVKSLPNLLLLAENGTIEISLIKIKDD